MENRELTIPALATEQTQSVRITRAAAKRSDAAVAAEQQPPAKKNRTVLGEITNLSKPISSADPTEPGKPRRATKTKKSKKAVAKPECDEKRDADSAPDDPQMCGPYVPDIYAYILKMEVNWDSSIFDGFVSSF